jgi:hypothetical protein
MLEEKDLEAAKKRIVEWFYDTSLDGSDEVARPSQAAMETSLSFIDSMRQTTMANFDNMSLGSDGEISLEFSYKNETCETVHIYRAEKDGSLDCLLFVDGKLVFRNKLTKETTDGK